MPDGANVTCMFKEDLVCAGHAKQARAGQSGRGRLKSGEGARAPGDGSCLNAQIDELPKGRARLRPSTACDIV